MYPVLGFCLGKIESEEAIFSRSLSRFLLVTTGKSVKYRYIEFFMFD